MQYSPNQLIYLNRSIIFINVTGNVDNNLDKNNMTIPNTVRKRYNCLVNIIIPLVYHALLSYS